jgi:spore coat polysaccharide biosynthesis protein SpsF
MKGALAFLQGRMGSTRLPGKAMIRIRGKTILERAVARLEASTRLQGVVVLTTTRDEDAILVEEARRLGAEVFRGPDLDVLARFRQAADLYRPEVIVRATADNPLIDIGSVDRILLRLEEEGLDYCCERGLPIGAATEAITRAALERADLLGLDPHHREHVTIYVKEHLEDFRTAFPDAPGYLNCPDLRITVDTPADLEFVERLIGAIPESDFPVDLREYLRFVARDHAPARRGCTLSNEQ